MLVGCTAPPHRVLYVNSYHAGYASSDSIRADIEAGMTKAGVELKTICLDSKRNGQPDSIARHVQEALRTIESWRPDVLMVSDDNAVSYLVTPHLMSGPLPVVFCGVNWSCEQYGLPNAHVTGMLEVLPIEASLKLLKAHVPGAKTLTILSENTPSEISNKKYMDHFYTEAGLTPTYVLVNTFAGWKQEFIRANRGSDLVYLPTNGAIRGWDNQEAEQFVRDNIRVPVFTCDDFMMPYAVVGLTKIAREQGDWAAETALKILNGASPADIPITENRLSQAWLNPDLAEKIGFTPGPGENFINMTQH